MKTLEEKTYGKATVRLLETSIGYTALVLQQGNVSGRFDSEDREEAVAKAVRSLGEGAPAFIGYDGAQKRFLEIFADGFSSKSYLTKERDHKVNARETLLASVPLEAARHAGAEHCADVMKAFSKTFMLSQFELARISQLLKSDAGPSFIQSAAAFAGDDIASGLAGMRAAIKPIGALSWPIATYLPFLWRPEAHMFLKPQVTVDFAERVGHPFAYQYAATCEAPVYQNLLSLVGDLEQKIAALQPRDRIDVQSFIWVVGKYEASDAA